MLRYLPQDAVFTFASATDIQGLQDLHSFFQETISLFVPNPSISPDLDMIQKGYDGLADSSAFSLDFALSEYVMAYFADPTPEGLPRLLEELDIEITAVVKLEDKDQYIAYMEEIFTTDFFSQLAEGLTSGPDGQGSPLPPVDFSVKLIDDPLGLPIYNKAIDIALSFEKTEDFEDTQTANTLLAILLEALPVHFAVSDDLLVLTVGDATKIEEILVKGSLSHGSMGEMENMITILEGAPQKLTALGSLSLAPFYRPPA
jgi:hypothetical protein